MPILQDNEKLQHKDYKGTKVYKTEWFLKKSEMWYKRAVVGWAIAHWVREIEGLFVLRQARGKQG